MFRSCISVFLARIFAVKFAVAFAPFFDAYFCIFMRRLNLHSILFFRVFSPYLLLHLRRYFFAFCAAYFAFLRGVFSSGRGFFLPVIHCASETMMLKKD
jgi:hypothetical protein